MIMRRQLQLAVLATALAAFAMPAVTSANTLSETGVPVSAGASVTETSANWSLETAVGAIQCGKVTVHSEVVSNTPLVLAPVGAISAEECVTTTGRGITVTDWTHTVNRTWASFSSSTSVSMTFHIYTDTSHTVLLATCSFSGSASDTFFGLISTSSSLSGNCGNGVGNGVFNLETSNGHPLELK